MWCVVVVVTHCSFRIAVSSTLLSSHDLLYFILFYFVCVAQGERERERRREREKERERKRERENMIFPLLFLTWSFESLVFLSCVGLFLSFFRCISEYIYIYAFPSLSFFLFLRPSVFGTVCPSVFGTVCLPVGLRTPPPPPPPQPVTD